MYAVLYAYRNTPHESTGEKPSYLLFGNHLRTPTEAAYLPETKNALVSDLTTYREKLVVGLSLAREQAAEAMQRAQRKYKKYYDKGTHPNPLQRTDWVMIRFPQEETGAGRKLSRPWHGPYRVLEVTHTGIVAEKVYSAQDGTIQVHLNRVTKCPGQFPAGYYWYGSKRKGPGRPPKWLDKLNMETGTTPELHGSLSELPSLSQQPSPLDSTSPPDATSLSDLPPEPPKQRKTRTRIIKSPQLYST